MGYIDSLISGIKPSREKALMLAKRELEFNELMIRLCIDLCIAKIMSE